MAIYGIFAMTARRADENSQIGSKCYTVRPILLAAENVARQVKQMDQQEKKYWMALQAEFPADALALARRILGEYGSMDAFWRARDTARLPEISEKVREKLVLMRTKAKPEVLLETCLRRKTGILCFLEEIYPKELLHFSESPAILYYHGDVSLLSLSAASIVGSRRCSDYGRKMAGRFAAAFAETGLCVVSGMAKGVDAAAHEGALEVGGKTIAVLGSGVDVPYPPANQDLYWRIRESGLVVSEFPPGAEPAGWHFPLRNRIISGLGLFLLLVEGEAKSGALITCDWAAEQGRDVWAIPGPVTNPYSIAPLKLIQDGALLAITPEDILRAYYPERYGKSKGERKGQSPGESGEGRQGAFMNEKEAMELLDPSEKSLLERISYYPLHVDLLLENHDKRIYLDLARLLSLRLIERLPGDYYQRV